MTDNEIIEAVECCERNKDDCAECPHMISCFKGKDTPFFLPELLNLLNRQKAEIKRMTNEMLFYMDKYHEFAKTAECVKIEAIKEFAERLNYKIVNTSSIFTIQKATHEFLSGNAHRQQEILDYIYDLVKKMTEGKENA